MSFELNPVPLASEEQCKYLRRLYELHDRASEGAYAEMDFSCMPAKRASEKIDDLREKLRKRGIFH